MRNNCYCCVQIWERLTNSCNNHRGVRESLVILGINKSINRAYTQLCTDCCLRAASVHNMYKCILTTVYSYNRIIITVSR